MESNDIFERVNKQANRHRQLLLESFDKDMTAQIAKIEYVHDDASSYVVFPYTLKITEREYIMNVKRYIEKGFLLERTMIEVQDDDLYDPNTYYTPAIKITLIIE